MSENSDWIVEGGEIINLTPHRITLIGAGKKVLNLDSKGEINIVTHIEKKGRLEVKKKSFSIDMVRRTREDISQEQIDLIKEKVKDKDVIVVPYVSGVLLSIEDRITKVEKERIFVLGKKVKDKDKHVTGARALECITDMEVEVILRRG